MLNIVSNEYFKSADKISGPIKVFRNLLNGLRRIGYPFIVNGALNSCDKLWIYNDPKALVNLTNLTSGIKVLLGPGFYLDRCISDNVRKILSSKSDEVVCLQPSDWSRQFVLDSGFKLTPVETWPVGVDTDEFKPRSVEGADRVVIYFKQRFSEELEAVERTLREKGIKYEVIVYGHYLEDDYKKALRQARYVIWIGRQESQGIALEEALAMDIPILVWDVKKVGHWLPPPKDVNIFTAEENEYAKATAVPYFDNRCGLKFTEVGDLRGYIEVMEEGYKSFHPREYIEESLSLEKQARDFINIFDKYWGMKFEDGLNSQPRTKKKWKNEYIWRAISRIYYLFKRIVPK